MDQVLEAHDHRHQLPLYSVKQWSLRTGKHSDLTLLQDDLMHYPIINSGHSPKFTFCDDEGRALIVEYDDVSALVLTS